MIWEAFFEAAWILRWHLILGIGFTTVVCIVATRVERRERQD